METRAHPWAFVPGANYSREDMHASPRLTQSQLGKLQGFEVELMYALAKRLGVEAQIVPTSWYALETELLAGRFDVILSSWTPNLRTAETILASVPYCNWGLVIVVRADDPRVRGLADLEGLRVAHARDPAVLAPLWNMGEGKFLQFEDPDRAFAALETGTYDAIIYDSFYVKWKLAQSRSFRVVGEPLNRLGYHAGVRPEDAPLKERLDTAIHELETSGELSKLRQRWQTTLQ